MSEAASRLGERAGTLMPAQPWPDIRGMGNRLRHGYDRLDIDVLWNVVDVEIASLLADARDALQRLAANQR
ncbi:HepT-like ribonuclease domain-containing protein [Beijerinckia sp. L45]|uniref:HepT-like ribonuclease domain-containing protein n=1 Tax=Beijerinckia sp. L45 TaxID=1641855 RepID=UPI00131C94D3